MTKNRALSRTLVLLAMATLPLIVPVGAQQFSDRAKKIGDAYELTWGRPPEPAEVERWLSYLGECRSALARAQTPQPAIERKAWSSLAKVMLTSNEFLYID